MKKAVNLKVTMDIQLIADKEWGEKRIITDYEENKSRLWMRIKRKKKSTCQQ